MGMTTSWEGLCLDRRTCHWMPYPIVIKHINIDDNANDAPSPPAPAPLQQQLNASGQIPGSTVLAARCHWPTQMAATRMSAVLYPVGAGLGQAWFACEASGRYVRWATFTETELLDGEGVLLPNTYWGLMMGSIFVGRYDCGGAVCLFMKEICCAPRAAPCPALGIEDGSACRTFAAADEQAVMLEGERFEGIILFSTSVVPSLPPSLFHFPPPPVTRRVEFLG